jgi:pantoate--beta-alanine ligase
VDAVLSRAEGLELDYAAVTKPDLWPAPEAGEARLLLAAKVGTTRLIDNGPIVLGSVNSSTSRAPLTPLTGV